MKALKGNRVYTVDDTTKEQYLQDGFDLYDDSGELITVGKNKTIDYDAYQKLTEEHDALKKSYAELQQQYDALTAAKDVKSKK